MTRARPRLESRRRRPSPLLVQDFTCDYRDRLEVLERPAADLTVSGRRYYFEVEGPGAPRGLAHRLRITANDPRGQYREVEIESGGRGLPR